MGILFLAPIGRSGSTLTHVLLANHPNVRTTECFISLSRVVNLEVEENIIDINDICKEQLNLQNNLWVLDSNELTEIMQDLKDHSKCVCRRIRTKDSIDLIHVHNIFYDRQEFELAFKLMQNNENSLLVLCDRDWIQTISSRQRSYPCLESPKWVSVMYWIVIENNARLASLCLSNYVKTLKIDLLKWHKDPINTWENLLSFINIKSVSFPMQPQLRGRRWSGGRNTDKVVEVDYVEKLSANSLTKLETHVVRFFMGSNNSIFLSVMRKILFYFADFIIYLQFVIRAIKIFPKYLKRKTCELCNNSKRKRYTEVQLPGFAKQTLDYIWHIMHVLRSGGAYNYRVARKNSRKWQHTFRKINK